jgi:hypothetical protein
MTCALKFKCPPKMFYVHESLKFSNINLLKYSKEQDKEIAATQLNIHRRKVIIICIYRAHVVILNASSTNWKL